MLTAAVLCAFYILASLTAIMTSRFILDLHEAADPRFDQSNAVTGSRTSTLIFSATSKHAPHFDSDHSFDIGTMETDYHDPMDDGDRHGASVAEGDNLERQWEVSPTL